MARSIGILFFALSMLATTTAFGQQAQDDAGARLHFQSGASYYDAGEYADALREFQHAFQLSHKPELHYNISLCYQGLNDLPNAATSLERYLREVPEVPNRANLELRLQNLQRRASESTQATPPPTEGTPATPPPAETDTTSPPADTAEPSSGGGPPVGAIVGFSVGGAGLLAAGIFGILAISEEGSIQDGCGATKSCTEDDVSSMDSLALISDIGLVVGIAGAGVGLALLLASGGDDDEAPPQTAFRVAPWADPRGGGGATLQGSF